MRPADSVTGSVRMSGTVARHMRPLAASRLETKPHAHAHTHACTRGDEDHEPVSMQCTCMYMCMRARLPVRLFGQGVTSIAGSDIPEWPCELVSPAEGRILPHRLSIYARPHTLRTASAARGRPEGHDKESRADGRYGA